jgi:hypothetical protein|tara:strand:+ start:1965 stop:2768 length:804 start_codon:yes stop_codon:yes gene_type:complete
MKYYLIIGYQLVEKHKEFPIVRVHVDGQLVDEFECDNEQSTEVSLRERRIRRDHGTCYDYTVGLNETNRISTPEKHKVIELDSSTWSDQSDLVIEVSNNNSNYCNGFISKRSLVWLTPVFLIRKDIHDDPYVMHRIIKRSRLARMRPGKSRESYTSYSSAHRTAWPGESYSSWPGVMLDVNNHKLGGNYKRKFNIRKKYKTHMLVHDDQVSKGYLHLDLFAVAWYQHYSKKYFEMVLENITNLDAGATTTNLELREKSKEINTNDED